MKEIEDTSVANFPSKGCDIESLRRAREAGVTAAELRCKEFALLLS